MVRFPTLAGPAKFAVSALCTYRLSHPTLILSNAANTTCWKACLRYPQGTARSSICRERQRSNGPPQSGSDPYTFNIYLLNKDIIPSLYLKIASNLTTSDDEYTFDSVDVLPGSGYIFAFKDVSSNNTLAQSGEFSIVVHADSTTASVATSTATATSTGTATGSSTDAQTGAGARTFGLPVAEGAMIVVVGMIFALQGNP
ncbi:hypothetical protein N7462_001702 [Penicillium macrosclerotiorum]|uniref:uncharacterized protein n=1 Tax=Penicillium macrosclerotiorum TaxID=303699 RepID=UPI0025475155|nr:uncharacterized protein N7462_001702 [Penicillium macrosclerotiorum]KAJ5692279.1 hypothetical protein N7462_001702 [Penicillium macrosclerotiorum]